MSSEPARVAPRRKDTCAAADGVCNGCVTVASTTAPSCSGAMPACATALPAAATAMSTTDSSGAAKRRETMPVRSRIHSSEESIRSQISAFVTTRAGR
jgi:hypothetical protein